MFVKNVSKYKKSTFFRARLPQKLKFGTFCACTRENFFSYTYRMIVHAHLVLVVVGNDKLIVFQLVCAVEATYWSLTSGPRTQSEIKKSFCVYQNVSFGG